MLHPLNDRLKIKVDKKNGLDLVGGNDDSTETGIVVEVPDLLLYLSFHSFAFEQSLASDKLERVQAFYNNLLNKRVYWEVLQDRGRRIREGDDEYIYLQMTDVLAYSEETDVDASVVNDARSGGFKI